EAVRLFTSYTSEHPDKVWGFYMLGLSAWKTGDRDAAVRAFTQALEKDSTHVKSRLNLSRVLIEQGKAQEALPYVEGVVTIDSTSNEAYRLLGRVKRELGDSSGAIEAYKKAIVLDERDAWSMNNLAKVYIGQGQFEEALGPLEEHRRGIRGEWCQRERHPPRLHAPPQPDSRRHTGPREGKEQHRGEHLDARERILRSLGHTGRDEPDRPIRRIVHDEA